MKFNTYARGKETIHATETAYNAIYKARGFVLKPVGEPPGTEVIPNEGAEGTDAGGSDGAGNAENTAAGKSKKPKS